MIAAPVKAGQIYNDPFYMQSVQNSTDFMLAENRGKMINKKNWLLMS